MKKGICLTALYPQAMRDKSLLIELFKKIAGQGVFNCVEYYFEGSLKDISDIRRATDKLELYTVYLAGFPMKAQAFDLSGKDEAKRIESVVFCKKLLMNARNLGAKKMLILSGPVWKEKQPENVLSQMKKSILELLAIRNHEDPQITLEFFNDMGEPYLAFGNINLVHQLLLEIQDDGFGVTFDTSHVAQLNEDVLSAYEILGPWIHHLHLANSVSKVETSPLYGDKHPLFGVKDGDFNEDDMMHILQILKEGSFWKHLDVCSFEIISRKDKSQEDYFEGVTCQAEKIFSYI